MSTRESKRGVTLKDVKAAYGEQIYVSITGIYTYEDDDYDYDLQLTIYEDRGIGESGITEIDLSSYKND